MRYNWNQLLCPYFYTVASAHLGSNYKLQGFALTKTRTGGLICQRCGTYVEISFVPETSPNYSPSVIVGVGEEPYDDNLATTGVPAWFLIPDELPARRYSLWTFNSASRLEIVLRQLRTDVLEPYIEPLCNRSELLEDAITRFRRFGPHQER